MTSTMKMRIPFPAVRLALSLALLFAAPLALAPWANAQAPARIVGSIAAIDSATLSVKTDGGELRQVNVPGTASIKRIAPGQKDLSGAETLQFGDLATGDRVLVKLDPDAPAGMAQALQVIAIKQADVALKQQKDREDWQRRGVAGLVKSVDATAGVVVVTSGAGADAKTVAVRTAKSTLLKRYAPASVRYDEALPASIDAIRPGDQLRARGAKSADGTEIAAEEVVSGSFRNISGTVVSVDTAASSLVVKDLATKKPVAIRIGTEAQMRRLPDRMAQMLAMRLKGGQSTAAGSAPRGGGQWGQGGGAGGGQRTGQGGGGQWGGGQGQPGGSGAWGGPGGGDPQQLLSRAPAIQLADLKKGDAVMVVSTDGAAEVTAITLLAGVEPLLEAPSATNLLANWSMNTGAGSAETGQ